MKQLLLQPVDTFFFRNHQNFTAGENSNAATIFPPHLSTIYGALRSAYIHQKSSFARFLAGSDPALKEWMGTTQSPGRLRLRGCFIFAEQQAQLPLPMDYQVIKFDNDKGEEATEIAYPLELRRDENLTSNGRDYCLYGAQEKKSSSSSGGFISFERWKKEILQRKGSKIYRSSRFIETEEKQGITRDWERKTAKEGMLYHLKMNRFKSLELGERSGFVVLCNEGPGFADVPYLRLGGKNRPWILQELPEKFSLFSPEEEERIIGQIEESGIARLILLSPAVWTEHSAYYQREKQSFRINQELELPILAEAMGRPTLLGGWDIARNAPKTRSQAVPAGSVLYLKVAKGLAGKLLIALKDAVLSDELGHEGYGWAVCGAANEKNSEGDNNV
ncbi:MAG: type III-B CRISPR module-associated Cmr3 family protein [Desulfitobacteriaceae bacterium]|nr:type III-B CRISPR module-associated Cmr3 family protein [Desulfitobacteriaceae bacterium]MDD4346639.1 type III-B CRISPR module-associated Cmr3 family protein [Desulfitobacteriaceae bacterium]MDD4401599.1 type III-B CRISPR module-associated Cmr3 family protein [Desulfitobacteriaceae bacterium]